MRNLCPICNGLPSHTKNAGVAPFLQIHAGVAATKTKSHFCNSCNFVWHEHGLSENQAARLYEEYRGEKYNQTRIELEKEYKEISQSFEDLKSDHYRERAGELDAIFRNYKGEIKNTLDYGGDALFSNWLFPFAQNDFFDLSHGTSASTQDCKYDVIFMFHLLEHVNYPLVDLAAAYELLRPGGLLITQVPREFDPPLPRAFQLTPDYSGTLMNMHEHMNFFTEKSMQEISKKTNIPLLGSHLMKWNGLVSFFTDNEQWLDYQSILNYESKRLEKQMNDQFQELRAIGRTNSSASNLPRFIKKIINSSKKSKNT
jgi:SAM-dependent methyltransferase